MKRFLTDNNVEYEYVDVDLCNKEDQRKIKEDIQSRGGRLTYPTIVVDDKILITGLKEDKLREILEL